MHEQKVLRAGENEPAWLVLPIHDPLDVREQVGDALGLVEDHLARELIQESPRVLHGERTLVRVFEGTVAMPWKGGSDQRRLARLAWSGNRHHGVFSGGGLEHFGQVSRYHRSLSVQSERYMFNVHNWLRFVKDPPAGSRV